MYTGVGFVTPSCPLGKLAPGPLSWSGVGFPADAASLFYPRMDIRLCLARLPRFITAPSPLFWCFYFLFFSVE